MEAGQKPLAEILEKADGGKLVSGADAFLLYDTYGYPLEITQDAAADRGIKVPPLILLSEQTGPLLPSQIQSSFAFSEQPSPSNW